MLNYNSLADIWEKSIPTLLKPPKGIQLPWWPKFTEYLGGLRPNELTLLCAPTGSGKTQLLANISAQLLHAGVPHFAAPVETGDQDFAIRLMSALEGLDLNMGEAVAPDVLNRITTKFAKLILNKKLFISTYDNRVDIEEMITMLKYMHQEYGCEVAVLDNLNFFLKVVSSHQEKAEMDNAIHEFVILAKKIPMHIILIVHPRKTLDGRVESEFDIKGSATAVQEAANVLLFNRPSKADLESGVSRFTDREFVFRKIRKRGIHVNKPIWLAYQNGRYLELKR